MSAQTSPRSLDFGACEMGCAYRMYAPRTRSVAAAVLSFHGGNFVDGSMAWDAEQNAAVSSYYNCIVYQIDLPKTCAEFLKWARSKKLRAWLRALARSYKTLSLIGRSSGGYLAKIFFDIHRGPLDRSVYLCPVFDPFRRAIFVADKRHGTYTFFGGSYCAMGDALKFTDREMIVVPYQHDPLVPIQAQPREALRKASSANLRTHKEVCCDTSPAFLALLRLPRVK